MKKRSEIIANTLSKGIGIYFLRYILKAIFSAVPAVVVLFSIMSSDNMPIRSIPKEKIYEYVSASNKIKYVIGVIGSICFVAAVLLIMRFFDKKKLSLLCGNKEKGKVKAFCKGFALAFVQMSAALALLLIMGLIKLEGMMQSPYIFFYLTASFFITLFAVTCEEFFFRAYLMTSSDYKKYPVTAVIVSAGFFSFLHIMLGSYSTIGILNIVLFAVVFSLVFVVYRNLYSVIGFRTGWNFLSVLFFGSQIYGVAQKPLIKAEIMKAELFETGNLTGILQNFAVTISLIIVTSILYILYRKRVLLQKQMNEDIKTIKA